MLNFKKINMLYERVAETKAKKCIGFEVVSQDENNTIISHKYYSGEVFSLEDALNQGIITSSRTYELVDAVGIIYFPNSKTYNYLHEGDQVVKNAIELTSMINAFSSEINNKSMDNLDEEDPLLELRDCSYVRQRTSER